MTRNEIIRDLSERSAGAGAGQYMSLRCDVAREIVRMLKDREAVEPKIFQSEDFLWSQWYICGACEYPVDPGDKFCRKCGKELKWDE